GGPESAASSGTSRAARSRLYVPNTPSLSGPFAPFQRFFIFAYFSAPLNPQNPNERGDAAFFRFRGSGWRCARWTRRGGSRFGPGSLHRRFLVRTPGEFVGRRGRSESP